MLCITVTAQEEKAHTLPERSQAHRYVSGEALRPALRSAQVSNSLNKNRQRSGQASTTSTRRGGAKFPLAVCGNDFVLNAPVSLSLHLITLRELAQAIELATFVQVASAL